MTTKHRLTSLRYEHMLITHNRAWKARDFMTRPCCLRRIAFMPGVRYFKPAGIPLKELEEITIALDELEALRLADLEGLYQEQAAKKMKISRPTFARIVETARRKTASALIHGKALRLEGGAVVMNCDPLTPSESDKRAMRQEFCGCRHRRQNKRNNK